MGKLWMRFSQVLRRERGITGLETAIILIAFVVVASVFAYTVLSAGIFSSQKGQEAVYGGLNKTQATLELKGDVTYNCSLPNVLQSVHTVQFIVANALTGGEAIDFAEPSDAIDDDGVADDGSSNTVVISYTDKDQRVENLVWTKVAYGSDDGDALLEQSEKFLITVGDSTDGTGHLEDALTPDLGTSSTFTLEIKTPKGASVSIERTTPDRLDTYGILN
jgi:flagellin FlaB